MPLVPILQEQAVLMESAMLLVLSDGTLTSSSLVRIASEIEEVVEKAAPENPVREED